MRKSENNNSINKIVDKVSGYVDILVCLLTFIIAISKGGFYKSDILFPTMCICILGLICVCLKLYQNILDHRKLSGSILVTIIDVSVIIMPIAYFLPVVFNTAASMENSIFEVLRWICIAVCYYIVRISNNPKIYLQTIWILGMIIATFGIDEITYRSLETVFSTIGINYLDGKTTLSSVMQYANVSGLCMLLASIITQEKISRCENKVLKHMYISINVILQICIFCTTSRMNIFLMIITSILMYIYKCIAKKGNNEHYLLSIIISLITYSSIERYIILDDSFVVIISMGIAVFVVNVIYFVMYQFITNTKVKLCYDRVFMKIQNKRNVVIYISIIILGIVAVLFTIPAKWKISSNNNKEVEDTKYIYDISLTENKLEFDYEATNDADYEVFVFECYTTNQSKYVGGFKSNIPNNVLNISSGKDAYKLMIKVLIKNGSITINNIKLNNKNVTVNYLLLPDAVVHRFKETITHDQNNELRKTYYYDALKLFRKSMIIGIGGEGFNSRYQEVQQSGYISSKTHSMPLKILVETGSVGIIAFLAIICSCFMIIYTLILNKQKNAMLYLLLLLSYVIQATFDLTFSFGAMQLIYIMIIGIVVNEYKTEGKYGKTEYILDNKSWYGYCKTSIMFIASLGLIIASVYSSKIYASTMINSNYVRNDAESINVSVELYKKKISLDKYNVNYLRNLYSLYEKQIEFLEEKYINEGNENQDKNAMLLRNCLIEQKTLVDEMLEYEYYNKYVIENVATCYLNHFISYSSIYKKSFETTEVAYSFYLNYALKLTDRLKIVGPYNENSKKMQSNIYNMAHSVLNTSNKYLNSIAITQIIKEIESKIDITKVL